MTKSPVLADVNVTPFLTDVVTDTEMTQASVDVIKEAGLDDPYFLVITIHTKKDMHGVAKLFIPNYQGDVI